MNVRLLCLAGALIGSCTPALAQGARDNIDALIEVHAKASGVPSAFIHKVIKRESNYNPKAKGGSALGLMQIKHATARGLGYKGDAPGLYDPETNLRYGIAYLAGAYKAAKGDLALAYQYYNRGYYYAAKKLGITSEVADATPAAAPSPNSAGSFANLFTLRPSDTGGQALAYAQAASAAAPTESVEVPLPPRRPASLGGTTLVASLAPAADLSALAIAPAAAAPVQPAA
ncbi:transglycosylase SLT domain-containing protein, partial [Methylobacterium sp. CG08_land_8_20_14_0_20_71_15]